MMRASTITIHTERVYIQTQTLAPPPQQQHQQRRLNFMERLFGSSPATTTGINRNNRNSRALQVQERRSSSVPPRMPSTPAGAAILYDNSGDDENGGGGGGAVLTFGPTVIRLNEQGSGSILVSATRDGAAAAADGAGEQASHLMVPSKKHHASSEDPEHRFWLKAELLDAILELQSHDAYAGTVLHSTRLALFVQESVGNKLRIPLYIGQSLCYSNKGAAASASTNGTVYTEHELRLLFRQVCHTVQVLHENHVAHRNLHLNQILVDPSTANVSLRGFQHAVLLKRRSASQIQLLQDEQEQANQGHEEKEQETKDSIISDLDDSFPTTTTTDDQRDVYYTDLPLVQDDTSGRRRYDWYAFRAPELEIKSEASIEAEQRLQQTPGHAQEHGTAVDIWSLGAALYVLLTGLPPFRGSGNALREAKRNADIAPYDITVPTAAAQDLVARMLRVDPTERLNIAQVLQHEWFQTADDDDLAAAVSTDLSLAQTFLMDWSRRGKPPSSKRRRSISGVVPPPPEPNVPDTPSFAPSVSTPTTF